MADPTTESKQVAPARRPARRRQLIALLAAMVTVLMALSQLLDDQRFFDSAVPLGAALATMLLVGANRPDPEPDAGRSPWTPPTLFALAVVSGSALGLAGLGLQVEDPAVAHALLVAVLLLLVADVAVLVTVLVRGHLRGESVRARPFPTLSAADRHRAGVMAATLVGFLYTTIALAPWVRGELWFWVPLAIVDTLAPALLLWWVVRSASAAT